MYEYEESRYMLSMRGFHWGMFLGQGLEIMETLLMAGQVVRSLDIEVCDPGGVSNGSFSGNLGENPLAVVLGADIGSERDSPSGISYSGDSRGGLLAGLLGTYVGFVVLIDSVR